MTRLKRTIILLSVLLILLFMMFNSVSYACDTWKAETNKSYEGNMIAYTTTIYNGNIVTFITLVDQYGDAHEHYWHLEQSDIITHLSYTYFWEYADNGKLDNIQVVSIDSDGNETLIEDY